MYVGVFVAVQWFVLLIPLIVDVFASVLVCIPDLFSLTDFVFFEQRYTTVAFIYPLPLVLWCLYQHHCKGSDLVVMLFYINFNEG